MPEPLWQIYAEHREDYFADPRTRSSGLEVVLHGRQPGWKRVPTSWNPAAERMFGYSSAEIIGKSNSILTPSGRAREIISILAQISSGRSVTNFETVRIRKDGQAIGVSLTISPIRGANGAIVGASVIHQGLARQEEDS